VFPLANHYLTVSGKNKNELVTTAASQKQGLTVSEKIERQMILNIITTFFNDPVKAELMAKRTYTC
jgi:hypothetical protein